MENEKITIRLLTYAQEQDPIITMIDTVVITSLINKGYIMIIGKEDEKGVFITELGKDFLKHLKEKTGFKELVPNISYPILKCVPSNSGEYLFIITDKNNVEHYFNKDGTYDGWSNPPCTDGSSGISMN